MSDIEAQKQALFAKWAETELNAREQEAFENWCKDDADFAEKVAVHGRLTSLADNFPQQEVPHWDAAAIFEAPQKAPWWQWRGLPAMSFAMSLFAILLVTFKLEVTINDGNMVISFGGHSEQQKLEKLVNDKFLEYAQQQDSKFADKSEQLQQQQMQMNTQLASFLLDTSRSERREDFAELIKHVNQQRADDQVFYARQINRITNEFEQGESPQWLPGDFQQSNFDAINSDNE